MRIVTIAKIEDSDIPCTSLHVSLLDGTLIRLADTSLPGATWSVVEAEIAITCACLPTLRPLISKTDWVQRTKNRLSTCSIHKSRMTSVSRLFAKSDSWSDRVVSLAATDAHRSEDRPHNEVTENRDQSHIITVGMISQGTEWDNQRTGTANQEGSMV